MQGTINCAVITRDGIVVGVDSRGVVEDTLINELEDTKEEYFLWRSDSITKYKHIGEGICLTAAGDGKRGYALLTKLEELDVTDFDRIVLEIENFIQCESVVTGSITTLVVGYSQQYKSYAIVSQGDCVDKKVFKTPGEFCVIGSGGEHATQIFESKKELNIIRHEMSLENAEDCVRLALTAAGLHSVSCGGNLYAFRVVRGTRNLEVENKTLIDLYLKSELVLPRGCILFFCQQSHKRLNYRILELDISRFYSAEDIEDFVRPKVYCLGYACPGVTAFVSGLGDHADKYFSQCRKIVDSRYPMLGDGTCRLKTVLQPVAPRCGTWEPKKGDKGFELAEIPVMVCRDGEEETRDLLDFVANYDMLKNVDFSNIET